jgi:hypothetical protein
VASRIALDPDGRPVVEQTTEALGIPRGTRFFWIGNCFRAGERGITRLGSDRGRPPTPQERLKTQPPYSPA